MRDPILPVDPLTGRAPQGMTDEQATAEVAWVARRARELMDVAPDTPGGRAQHAEFYRRKAALLRHIGEPELAATAAEHAARWID